VLLRERAARAFQAADELRRRLLLLGAAGTLAFMALSLWLATRVARPIQLLSAGAMRVVHHQPPDFAEMPPRRRDEVAELARALRALHGELSRQLVEQQRATERYQTLFRSAPVAVFVMQDDRLQLANEACLKLFGAPDLAALIGKTPQDLVHPDDYARLAENQRQLRLQAPHEPALPVFEHRIVRLDGSVALVEATAMPLTLGDTRGVQVVLHDVTEPRQAQAQLRQREAQLLQTSQMARVGGWTLDLATQRASWTDEMAHIYDLPPDTVVTPALALAYFHGDALRQLKAALGRLLQNDQPYDLELQLRTPAGQVKWVRAFARAIQQDGRTVQLEGMTQDITERRAAQEALQALNAQLEQRVADRTAELSAVNAELDAFAYAVSHDLRAPLRAMSGFSQALIEDHGPTLGADARDLLDQIILASARMGDLIEGLLALSRSVRGVLRDDVVDLSALATLAVSELRRAEPGRAVQVQIESGLVAAGDRRMLAAVLGNLLGNAWKYTAGRPDACIELSQRTIDGERWFCVTDNGVGFDMAHAGRLFKVFARLHRQDEFPGLGIGLATVQRIIQRHGGRIVADASPGAGASFRFTLPARRAATLSESAVP
jgi:PAS domain S-box-containing protein